MKKMILLLGLILGICNMGGYCFCRGKSSGSTDQDQAGER